MNTPNQAMQNARAGANRAFSNFRSNKYVAGAGEFLNSNSIVAKFAFLILVIVVFMLLLRLGASLIGWFLTPSPNPILINGMIKSNQLMVIPQDPNEKGSIPILRSVNDVTGMEFTWSVWVYIEESSFDDGKKSNRSKAYSHIFHKGNDNINHETGLVNPNNAPGLYLSKKTNELLILMNTFEQPTNKPVKRLEAVTVEDVPINKWVNIVLRINKQHQLDVYINGSLVKRHIFKGVPRQNYGDVFVSMNGGFEGYTSQLRYFNSAIGTTAIQNIVAEGPDMKMITSGASLEDAKPHYLSTKWYFSGVRDLYNP